MDQQKIVELEEIIKQAMLQEWKKGNAMILETRDAYGIAEHLTNIGYRKQSEVVKEFFEEIEKILKESEYEAVDDYDSTTTICHSVVCIMSGLDKLRKKYMQERES